MKKVLFLLICLILLFSISASYVSAAENTVMPRFNNASYANASFTINSSGVATINASYDGYEGITTGARITILLEKKTFFFFWSDVQEWTISSNESYGSFTRSCTVEEGDYRATVTFEISGSGGATDVIERELEYSY